MIKCSVFSQSQCGSAPVCLLNVAVSLRRDEALQAAHRSASTAKSPAPSYRCFTRIVVGFGSMMCILQGSSRRKRDGYMGWSVRGSDTEMLPRLHSLATDDWQLTTPLSFYYEPHNRFHRYVDAAMFGCICGNCATFRTDRSCTTGNRDLLSIEDQSRT